MTYCRSVSGRFTSRDLAAGSGHCNSVHFSPSIIASGCPDRWKRHGTPKPLSDRVVAYKIDARVDTWRKTIDAAEVLTYHNLGSAVDLAVDQPSSTPSIPVNNRAVSRDHDRIEKREVT
jgi:hypothetical protein